MTDLLIGYLAGIAITLFLVFLNRQIDVQTKKKINKRKKK